MLKDGADPLRPLGEATHVADRRTLQLRLAGRRRLARDHLFEVGVHSLVGVESLVRVEIRTVRREVVHLVLSELAPNPTA